MLGDTKNDALKRVNYIDGHLAGVRKMIAEDRYCVDVIRQTYAIRRALQKLEGVLVDGHLRSCVPDAYHEGRDVQMLDHASTALRSELNDLASLGSKMRDRDSAKTMLYSTSRAVMPGRQMASRECLTCRTRKTPRPLMP